MAGLAGALGVWRADVPRSRRDLLAYVGALALVAAAYYVGARVGLTLALVERNVTPLWPPTGIALAAFLLFGRALWPGVAVAAFAVNLPISEGPIAAAVTAAGNTAAPLLAAALLSRVGFRRQLDRLQDALAIVFLGALASTLVSATVGSAVLVFSGAIDSDELPGAWTVWWTGDAMGILTVAPFLLCLPLFRELPRWSAARWLEAGVVLVLAAAVTVWTAVSELQLLFVAIIVVGWASWRLQLRGAAPVALVVSLVATRSAAQDAGPFAHETLAEQMIKLHAFNACVALTSFFLAALVSERARAAQALTAAAAELEERVRLRTAELSEANARLLTEIQGRSDAEEQLSHEEARARREHQIAVTLQRTLLPDRLPRIPAVALSARYMPASADMEVGGDWYDAIQLPDGLVGLAIGDVAGHGLQAAATMGQLRMALRAYAVQDPSPVSVMSGTHRLVTHFAKREMVTLIYLVYDPATRTLRFSNAGHPPPLVVSGGEQGYLEGALSPPLGVTAEASFTESRLRVPEGATVLLYTDGLIERRRESIEVGLERLLLEAHRREGADVDELCDHLLATLIDPERLADDIALVAMRPLSLVGAPLELVLPAEPQMLVEARRVLRQWLRDSGVAPHEESEILVACGEACANVVRHAYVATPGDMILEARLAEGLLEITVRDEGGWRTPVDRGGGWGLQLIHGLMDSVDVDRSSDGTVVRMTRRLTVAGA